MDTRTHFWERGGLQDFRVSGCSACRPPHIQQSVQQHAAGLMQQVPKFEPCQCVSDANSQQHTQRHAEVTAPRALARALAPGPGSGLHLAARSVVLQQKAEKDRSTKPGTVAQTNRRQSPGTEQQGGDFCELSRES